MLNESKIREKIREMQEQKVSRISWTEEGIPIGYANDITSDMRTASRDYMLEEVSINYVKLYMKVDDIYEAVMLFKK